MTKKKFLMFGAFALLLGVLCCGICCAADNSSEALSASTVDDAPLSSYSDSSISNSVVVSSINVGGEVIKVKHLKDESLKVKKKYYKAYRGKAVGKIVKKYSFKEGAVNKKSLKKFFKWRVKNWDTECCSRKEGKVVTKCCQADKWKFYKIKKIKSNYQLNGCKGNLYKITVKVTNIKWKTISYNKLHGYLIIGSKSGELGYLRCYGGYTSYKY